MISQIDIGWAAGFLEGDGSFVFGSRWKSNHPWSGSPQIAAHQKQREPLDRLHRLFGGNTPTLYHKHGPLKNKDIHQWRIYGERAVGLMMTIYREMSPQRKMQIRNALSAWRHAPGNTNVCKNGHDLTIAGARYMWRGQSHGCIICIRARALRRYYARA